MIQQGTAVVVKKVDGGYQHGYILSTNEKEIHVEMGPQREWYDLRDVYYLRRGYFVSLATVKAPPAKPSSLPVKESKKYNKRKLRENRHLIYDTLSVGIDIPSANLLALDDFPVSRRSYNIPNTTRHWINAGGAPGNIYVPNPDVRVTSAITAIGGHGFKGRLHDMIISESKVLPKMNVVFLDLCGYWSSNSKSVELLFSKRLLSEDKVLIHFTTCKREGVKDVMDVIFETLSYWCDKYFYGRCARLHIQHSSKMYKGSFVLGRRMFSS